MKTQMNEELKTKTNDDLAKLISEKREVLRSFRFAVEGSKTRNIREGRNTRREIARLLTELNARSGAKTKSKK